MTRHPEGADRPAPDAPPTRPTPPGHDLADRLVVTRTDQVRALAHPLRTTILGLLTERAASVAELAQATGRPRGTVAHHVAVLHDAGLLQVVRTRRVRAVEERFYGRAARIVTIAVDGHEDLPLDQNDFASATPAWTPPSPTSSGPGSVTSSRSSTGCPAAGTRRTAWSSASTPSPATPACRKPASGGEPTTRVPRQPCTRRSTQTSRWSLLG